MAFSSGARRQETSPPCSKIPGLVAVSRTVSEVASLGTHVRDAVGSVSESTRTPEKESSLAAGSSACFEQRPYLDKGQMRLAGPVYRRPAKESLFWDALAP